MRRLSDMRRYQVPTLLAGLIGVTIGVLPAWAAGDELTIALIQKQGDQQYFVDEANGALSKLGRDTLVQAMEKTGWVQAKAARILGLTPRQIGYALKKHGVEMKRF